MVLKMVNINEGEHRWTRKLYMTLQLVILEYELDDGNENECAWTMRMKAV